MALQDGVSVFHLTDLSYLTEYSAYTLFIYDNWGEYTPTEIMGGRYTTYTCVYPDYSPAYVTAVVWTSLNRLPCLIKTTHFIV